MKTSDPPIITSQHFSTTVEKLWTAITDPTEMKQWYFEMMPDFKAEVGFNTKFHIGVEDRNYTHLWEVKEVIPQKLVRYRWHYEEHLGDSQVIFEISEKESQLKLTVTCEVLEDFPQDLPEFKRESCQAGWNYLIKDRLVKHLKN